MNQKPFRLWKMVVPFILLLPEACNPQDAEPQATVYDLTFLNLPGYRKSAGDLIEQLDVGAGDTTLDEGCGTWLLTLP